MLSDSQDFDSIAHVIEFPIVSATTNDQMSRNWDKFWNQINSVTESVWKDGWQSRNKLCWHTRLLSRPSDSVRVRSEHNVRQVPEQLAGWNGNWNAQNTVYNSTGQEEIATRTQSLVVLFSVGLLVFRNSIAVCSWFRRWYCAIATNANSRVWSGSRKPRCKRNSN